jgi:predicted nuclease of restriction endonuclease-like (RecB) superfamily
LAYELEARKLQHPVAESDRRKLARPARESSSIILPQPVAEIPWGHNIVLLEKLKDSAVRLWYARQALANGWSRAMLTHWIESGLHARQGKAVTNFKVALPAPQSDLAAEVVRDPYNFDFLTLRADAAERDLERGLLDHIRKFLMELGAGFAFVGQQVHLDVGGEDFYLDLLFYHLRLRCYVVIDLKARPFKPEHAGRMNFYLSAVDDLLRHPDDKPSIGIILCKTRSRVIAEYALRDLAKPVGVARYKTRLVESLPDDLKGKLPTVQQIQKELAGPEKPKARKSPGKRRRRGGRKGAGDGK